MPQYTLDRNELMREYALRNFSAKETEKWLRRTNKWLKIGDGRFTQKESDIDSEVTAFFESWMKRAHLCAWSLGIDKFESDELVSVAMMELLKKMQQGKVHSPWTYGLAILHNLVIRKWRKQGLWPDPLPEDVVDENDLWEQECSLLWETVHSCLEQCRATIAEKISLVLEFNGDYRSAALAYQERHETNASLSNLRHGLRSAMQHFRAKVRRYMAA